MKWMSRTFGSAFVFAALLLSFSDLPVEGMVDLLLQADPSADRISLVEEQRRSVQLAEESTIVLARLRNKDRISQQVIAGDLTLLQAAARFIALNDTPESRENLRRAFPAHSEGESVCLQVMKWVESEARLRASPSQAEAVCRRLQEELCAHLEYHGTVTLSE